MSQGGIAFDYETRQFERRVLLLVALVQFVNIWDFMLVMPLGPDFSMALGIGTGHIGWIAGSYSIAAAIVGLASARFLDRFDRRQVLVFCLAGMAISTLSMALATTLPHLILLRIITGAFGGPVIASSLAIIADIFPDHRRGEAVGKVFGSFSLAAVLGVPLSLEIAHYFDWWAPFLAVSATAIFTIIITLRYLPPMRRHMENLHNHLPFSPLQVIRRKEMWHALLMVSSTMFSAFLLIPNISAHVQQNMGYPREWLGLLYFSGGVSAFFCMRFIGKKSDTIGYAKTALFATAILVTCVFCWFYMIVMAIPAPLYFILFMMGMSTRNVTSNALVSKIPAPHERAGFMSLMSAMQHLMTGVGATVSTFLLSEGSTGKLDGVEMLALISIAGFMVTPWLMFRIERMLKARTA